ncbi:hypothetical protein OSTOST_00295 [Ostertagia ostertagi]
MCCPSNEPTDDNRPSCPSPALTVLDSHGLPLKCSPRTRTCPQERMTCMDVGYAYVCCEQLQQERLHSNSVAPSERRRAPKSKNLRRKQASLEEPLDCPQNSIGLLTGDGSRVLCNSRRKCPGRKTFCHSDSKQSICCERYEFANNVLDNVNGTATSIHTATSDSAQLPSELHSGIDGIHMGEMKPELPMMRVGGSARLESTSAPPDTTTVKPRRKVVKTPSTAATEPETVSNLLTHFSALC